MSANKADDQYSDDEAARRRDEVVKRMLQTPPQPRTTAPKPKKPKERLAQKGRVHKAKSRS